MMTNIESETAMPRAANIGICQSLFSWVAFFVVPVPHSRFLTRARTQLPPFALYQPAQVVKQLDVVLGNDLHQIGERHGGRGARVEHLPEDLSGLFAMQFLATELRRISKSASLGLPRQQIFLVEAIESGHERGVSEPRVAAFDQLADGCASAFPYGLEQAAL